MLGLNPKDQDDLAKQLELVLPFLNDHEGDLANIPSLIPRCLNDHEGALERLLEPFHRLVWLYRKSARHMGSDLASLHKMAPEAGDGTPFLVIQAISKKSI